MGALKTPNWLGVREGLLDMRIRLTLESLAKDKDQALGAWTVDGYRTDSEKWDEQRLEQSRQLMLKRILELSK